MKPKQIFLRKARNQTSLFYYNLSQLESWKMSESSKKRFNQVVNELNINEILLPSKSSSAGKILGFKSEGNLFKFFPEFSPSRSYLKLFRSQIY